jgi:hypothetical protein
MRQITFLFALVAACSSVPKVYDEDYSSSQQEFNSNPPPRMICDYPLEACGGPRCVNLQWDNNNCGVCGNECERSQGEICHNFQCKSIEKFGFDSHDIVRGPVEYNPRRDLPRPTPEESRK